MLVFPTGCKIDVPTGLLEGEYADGRRMINFKDEWDNIFSNFVVLFETQEYA